MIGKKVIVSYPVPLNGEQESVGYVIDWIHHPQTWIDAQMVADAFSPHTKLRPHEEPDFHEVERIKRKLANTIRFVNHVKPSADEPGVLGQFVF